MGANPKSQRTGLLALILVAATFAILIPVQAVAEPSAKMRLVLLGTGNPNPEPERSGPSVAIVIGEDSYIIDFGPGVVRRATAANRRHNLAALDARNLRFGLLTHLHSDHTAGFPDLILTPWVMEREVPLRVFGPPGTTAMTAHILKAYEADIRNRIEGLQPATGNGWRVEAWEVGEGPVFEDEKVKIEAFKVCHGEWDAAFGYRFTTADRVIVISGDTTYCPNLVKWAQNADILLHEVYSQRAFKELEADWQRYHRAAHTSAPDVARIATETRPGLLVLYHQIYWFGATDEEILAEIGRTYKGPVVAGRDLDIF